MSAVTQPEVESYIADSLKAIEQLEQRVQSLETEKLTLEKVASSAKLDQTKLTAILDELEKLAFVNSDGKEQLKAFIAQDPNNIFSVLSKVASFTLETPSSGVSVKRIYDKRDTMGWDEFFSHPIYK